MLMASNIANTGLFSRLAMAGAVSLKSSAPAKIDIKKELINMRNCEKCNKKLRGIMIFFPELCFDCVIIIETKGYVPTNYLIKKEK